MRRNYAGSLTVNAAYRGSRSWCDAVGRCAGCAHVCCGAPGRRANPTPAPSMVNVCIRAGKLQADAAAAAGVKVFQFSMLEDVEQRTKARERS